MRYRGGGRIAGFDEDIPANSSYVGYSPGSWHLGEACQWLNVERWPERKIRITLGKGAIQYGTIWYADTTVGGVVAESSTIPPTIRADVSSEYPGPYSVIWEKSTDGGQNWSVVANDAYHAIQSSGYLSLFGQRRVNDGTLYRMLAVSGLRYAVSDNVVVWNDNVVVTFTKQPTQGLVGGVANITPSQQLDLDASAEAEGEYHGLAYKVIYSWQSATSQTGPWFYYAANPEGEEEGKLTFIPPPIFGTTYIRAVATFTYSSPSYAVADRADVVAYSDPVRINVVES